ncbi:hypothetical protein [Oceaniovalibus sp. ACAM 378]|uniref:hypothetical protein n=1 Tax=Oceaniovalibus sp. ACAM 378 TaxID=2599923 RepID=UPI0011D7EE4E|nr:hypothetical protein [Oceaniovalibus sp. ACAM 378]TYB88459.1 hypothetical protein FQ320_10730 [Oceaniovalibus sp. ACAM 378]
MTGIRETQFSSPQSRLGPKISTRRQAMLPLDDHRRLQQYLSLCETPEQPDAAILCHVLHHKIMTSDPVSNLSLRDLVTGGCRVEFSVGNGPLQTGLMSHTARSAPDIGVIPVFSLLGATLIGMRVGQGAPLLSEDGTIATLLVTGVEQPT